MYRRQQPQKPGVALHARRDCQHVRSLISKDARASQALKTYFDVYQAPGVFRRYVLTLGKRFGDLATLR